MPPRSQSSSSLARWALCLMLGVLYAGCLSGDLTTDDDLDAGDDGMSVTGDGDGDGDGDIIDIVSSNAG